METTNEKIKYAMYIRKSSESEDRQALSPESQFRENAKRLEERGIIINPEDIFQEAKTAKKPGREKFGEMMNRVEGGEYQGVVCWALDRLARNPIDGGRIMWAMQMGSLKHINTASGDHYPWDNVLVMQVHFGMANQFIIDLSKNTKRGLKTKAEMGYPPGVSKVGFRNDYNPRKGERKYIVDEERLPILQKLFEMFLSGNYSVRQIHAIARDELKLTSIERRKEGGGPLQLSRIYTLLKDPFYAGFFNYAGERYAVSPELPRIITEQDHHRILAMLGANAQPRAKKHLKASAYRGRVWCGSCEGMVVLDEKYQLICSECKHKFSYLSKDSCPKCDAKIAKMRSPKYLHYKYHHCSKSRNRSCPEGSVIEADLDEALRQHFLGRLNISKALAAWFMSELEKVDHRDTTSADAIKQTTQSQLERKRSELDEILVMRRRGLLTDEQCIAQKQEVEAEIKALGGAHVPAAAPLNLKELNRKITIAAEVERILENGTYEEKRELLLATDSNLTLKEKKVSVINDKLISLIMDCLFDAKTKNPAFEPALSEADKDETETFASVRPTLLRG